MKNPGAVAIHRGDYRAPAFWIDRVDLQFDLDATNTRVTSTLALRRNREPGAGDVFVLNGDGLTLESILHNGHALTVADYRRESDRIVINASAFAYAGDASTLCIITRFDPSANLALEGLYLTNGAFCTQCEAEGFRRITYFPDRPDVLSVYRVTIRADKAQFPVLLSNGNLVTEADLTEGRHEAVWHDPHKKPAYLFALVAGKIDKLTDHFVIMIDGGLVQPDLVSGLDILPGGFGYYYDLVASPRSVPPWLNPDQAMMAA